MRRSSSDEAYSAGRAWGIAASCAVLLAWVLVGLVGLAGRGTPDAEPPMPAPEAPPAVAGEGPPSPRAGAGPEDVAVPRAVRTDRRTTGPSAERFEVRVVDPAGRAVAGLHLAAVVTATGGGAEAALGTTDRAGVFAGPRPTPARFEVVARLVDGTVESVPVARGQSAAVLRLGHAVGTVAVEVLLADGRALPPVLARQVRVAVEPAGGGAPATRLHGDGVAGARVGLAAVGRPLRVEVALGAWRHRETVDGPPAAGALLLLQPRLPAGAAWLGGRDVTLGGGGALGRVLLRAHVSWDGDRTAALEASTDEDGGFALLLPASASGHELELQLAAGGRPGWALAGLGCGPVTGGRLELGTCTLPPRSRLVTLEIAHDDDLARLPRFLVQARRADGTWTTLRHVVAEHVADGQGARVGDVAPASLRVVELYGPRPVDPATLLRLVVPRTPGRRVPAPENFHAGATLRLELRRGGSLAVELSGVDAPLARHLECVLRGLGQPGGDPVLVGRADGERGVAFDAVPPGEYLLEIRWGPAGSGGTGSTPLVPPLPLRRGVGLAADRVRVDLGEVLAPCRLVRVDDGGPPPVLVVLDPTARLLQGLRIDDDQVLPVPRAGVEALVVWPAGPGRPRGAVSGVRLRAGRVQLVRPVEGARAGAAEPRPVRLESASGRLEITSVEQLLGVR